jgi:NADPH:quinone reductase-like Zn-dependent oxidoreductase
MPRVVVFDETGSPEVLRIVDEPVKEPAAEEVRIKIEAIGVNPLDRMLRTGTAPRTARLPHARLGCEATGTLDAVGTDVEGFSVGDAVIITAVPDMDVNGTYAEYVTVPAARIIHRPASLDVRSAAALWVTYSTAYGALIEKAGMQPGDQVLITAASSGVGLAAIQIANQIGAIPIAVSRHVDKKNDLFAAGAAAVIVTDDENVVDGARKHTGDVGADIILDSVMGPGLLELTKTAKLGGTLVTVGMLDPRPAPYPMNPLTHHRYMSFEHTLDNVVVRRMAAFLTAGLRTGALRPVIDNVFALDDIVKAHHHLEDGRRLGKIVVVV